MDVTAFVGGYVECALWVGVDTSDGMPPYGLVENNLSPEALAALEADCDAFLICLDKASLEAAARNPGLAGHDFFLTRNHHGAGFWDGDWPEAVGLRLSDMAYSQGERHLYVGDDSLIHVA